MKHLPFILLIIPLTMPASLLAHGSHGSGIMAGFTHPIFGLDHLAALIGLGLISSGYQNKQVWFPPVFFLGAMILGGFLGIGKDPFSSAETVILASVFVFGAFLVMRYRMGLFVFLILAVMFGFFHGLAHGIEMPAETTALKYISGYVLGAGLISILSVLAGHFILPKSEMAARVAGGILILGGIYFWLS